MDDNGKSASDQTSCGPNDTAGERVAENERLKMALDIAVKELKRIKKECDAETWHDIDGCDDFNRDHSAINNTLAEIEEAVGGTVFLGMAL